MPRRTVALAAATALAALVALVLMVLPLSARDEGAEISCGTAAGHYWPGSGGASRADDVESSRARTSAACAAEVRDRLLVAAVPGALFLGLLFVLGRPRGDWQPHP